MPDDDLLRAIEKVYSAVLAPADWPAALEPILGLVGGSHAFLHIVDGQAAEGSYFTPVRIDERDFARAFSPEALRIAAPVMRALPNGVVPREAVIADRDFERTEVYNEVIRPIDGFHSLHARRDFAAGTLLFSVCRPKHAAAFGAVEAATLHRLLPHLATAVELQHRLQVAESRSAGLIQLIERLKTGVILTDASGHPVVCNAMAVRILDRDEGLRLDGPVLAATTAAARRQLQDAILAAASGAAPEAQRLPLPRPASASPLLLTVLPVGRLGVDTRGSGLAQAAILVSLPDTPRPLEATLIADVFRLTQRECEIAVLVASGVGLAEVAARLDLALGTVRVHLKHVYEKTGTHHQAALVALLHSFVDPLS